MRREIMTCLGLILCACNSSKSPKKTIIHFDSVVKEATITLDGLQKGECLILYVDPLITTVVDVDCTAFESTFRDEISTVKLRVDRALLQHFSAIEETNIDVRLKIHYLRKGKMIEICSDIFGNFYLPEKNGFYKNDLLHKLISRSVPGWNNR